MLHNARTFSIHFRVRKYTLQLQDACVLATRYAVNMKQLIWMRNIMVSVWIVLLFLNWFITEDDDLVGRLIFDK